MKKVKQTIALILSVLMIFGITACTTPESKSGLSEQATAFIEKVNEIGTVSISSKTTIDEASALYNALSSADKEETEVKTAKTTLDTKTATYNTLADQAKANEDAAAFIASVALIPAAGSLETSDLAKIEAAETLYDALSSKAMSVSGVSAAYTALTAARAAINALIKDANTITISNAAEFFDIANDLTKDYKLTADIDFSQVAWQSIGGTEGFSGSLNGNGFTLKNINYTPGLYDGFSIFAKINAGAVVENLGITGCIANAGNWAGVICTDNYGTIKNCWTSVILASNKSEGYGGLIALNNQLGGVIEYCYTLGVNKSNGTIYSLDKGIMLLENKGTVTNCFARSDDNSFEYSIGKSKETSHLKTSAEMKQASLYSSWNTAIWNITEGSYPSLKSSGGTVEPAIYILNTEKSLISSQIQNNVIQIDAIALNNDSAITYSVKNGPVTGISINASGLISVAISVNTDFTIVASISGTSVSAEAEFSIAYVSADAVLIGAADDLLAIGTDAAKLSKSYILTGNIDLTGKQWSVLGDFTGTFDGNGYTISNFDFTAPSYSGFALFKSVTASAVVKNLKLEGTITNVGSWSGAITVDNYGLIENCITNIALGGTRQDSYCGGIALNNKAGGIIRNCIVLGAITATPTQYGSAPGAFVFDNAGTITNCFADKDTVGLTNGVGKESTPDTMLKTTAEMKEATLYSLFNTDVWNIVNGQYPALRQGIINI